MYDLPELAEVTDAWWAGLRRHLAQAGFQDLPALLSRPMNHMAHWLEEEPIFTQTCGYPLTHGLKGKMRLVATPRYDAPGCAGATYVSWVVVRRGDPARSVADLRDRHVAFNARDSQSGYNALRALVAPLARNGRFFAAGFETGAHRASLAAVKAGEADVAAVDCVSFALIRRAARAEMEGLRVLCATAAAPGLPYVTSTTTSDADLGRLRAGLTAACADPGLAETRSRLLLDGFDVLPDKAYDVIPAMEQTAIASGYPELA